MGERGRVGRGRGADGVDPSGISGDPARRGPVRRTAGAGGGRHRRPAKPAPPASGHPQVSTRWRFGRIATIVLAALVFTAVPGEAHAQVLDRADLVDQVITGGLSGPAVIVREAYWARATCRSDFTFFVDGGDVLVGWAADDGVFLEPLSNVVDWLASDGAGAILEGLFLLDGLEVAMDSSVFAAGWGASIGMIALGAALKGDGEYRFVDLLRESGSCPGTRE